MAEKKLAVIAGIGPGTGASLVEKFRSEGWRVAMLSRNETSYAHLEDLANDCRGYRCDVTSAEEVNAVFSAIGRDMGDVDVLVFNAGNGVFASVEDITPQQFEDTWRVNAMGSLLCSQRVIPVMRWKQQGAIVFIGATASRRGGPLTAAFAPAKAAQRSLAESMARTLWPAGIHVSLIVVDGFIDTPSIREMMPEKDDDFFIRPDSLASTAFSLAVQEKSAWTFETEARPFKESW